MSFRLNRRCHWFREDKSPISEGCRFLNQSRFCPGIHPNDAEWDTAPTARCRHYFADGAPRNGGCRLHDRGQCGHAHPDQPNWNLDGDAGHRNYEDRRQRSPSRSSQSTSLWSNSNEPGPARGPPTRDGKASIFTVWGPANDNFNKDDWSSIDSNAVNQSPQILDSAAWGGTFANRNDANTSGWGSTNRGLPQNNTWGTTGRDDTPTKPDSGNMSGWAPSNNDGTQDNDDWDASGDTPTNPNDTKTSGREATGNDVAQNNGLGATDSWGEAPNDNSWDNQGSNTNGWGNEDSNKSWGNKGSSNNSWGNEGDSKNCTSGGSQDGEAIISRIWGSTKPTTGPEVVVKDPSISKRWGNPPEQAATGEEPSGWGRDFQRKPSDARPAGRSPARPLERDSNSGWGNNLSSGHSVSGRSPSAQWSDGRKTIQDEGWGNQSAKRKRYHNDPGHLPPAPDHTASSQIPSDNMPSASIDLSSTEYTLLDRKLVRRSPSVSLSYGDTFNEDGRRSSKHRDMPSLRSYEALCGTRPTGDHRSRRDHQPPTARPFPHSSRVSQTVSSGISSSDRRLEKDGDESPWRNMIRSLCQAIEAQMSLNRVTQSRVRSHHQLQSKVFDDPNPEVDRFKQQLTEWADSRTQYLRDKRLRNIIWASRELYNLYILDKVRVQWKVEGTISKLCRRYGLMGGVKESLFDLYKRQERLYADSTDCNIDLWTNHERFVFLVRAKTMEQIGLLPQDIHALRCEYAVDGPMLELASAIRDDADTRKSFGEVELAYKSALANSKTMSKRVSELEAELAEETRQIEAMKQAAFKLSVEAQVAYIVHIAVQEYLPDISELLQDIVVLSAEELGKNLQGELAQLLRPAHDIIETMNIRDLETV